MFAPNCSFGFFMFLIVLGKVAESPEIIKASSLGMHLFICHYLLICPDKSQIKLGAVLNIFSGSRTKSYKHLWSKAIILTFLLFLVAEDDRRCDSDVIMSSEKKEAKLSVQLSSFFWSPKNNLKKNKVESHDNLHHTELTFKTEPLSDC